MKFTLRSILQQMAALYEKPRSRKRFEEYLLMLQGTSKDDMILPIAGYNPMAKEFVLEKLRELIALNAESIIEEQLPIINAELADKEDREIEVVINLIDDVGGAWSNYYATDYKSKFDIGALVKRNFCTPCFWTREDYSEDLIILRSRDYIYRTLYFLQKGKPKTLEDCIQQEVYVSQQSGARGEKLLKDMYKETESFFLKHKNSEEYSQIFNFFYGDEASESLGYAIFGMRKNAGFDYVKYLAAHN